MQEAGEELGPHLDIILQHLMAAFGKYQVHSCYFNLLCHAIWLGMNINYASKQ